MAKNIRNFKQLGNSGLRRYGNAIYEEFLPELRWPQAGMVYQEMSSNDPVIGAILYLAEMLIRGTTWSVEPASQSAEDVEAAEFLESCMHDMDTSWANTICEILSMFTYGFSFHEQVYKIRRGPNETNGKYIRRERFAGSCQRSFYVGDYLRQEDIKASFRDGILTLNIPKENKRQIEESKYIAIE